MLSLLQVANMEIKSRIFDAITNAKHFDLFCSQPSVCTFMRKERKVWLTKKFDRIYRSNFENAVKASTGEVSPTVKMLLRRP